MRLSLTPSSDPADYSFVHPIRTRFAETDAMGIIHHGAYVTYLEEARAALLRHGDTPTTRCGPRASTWPCSSSTCVTGAPFRFDEVVDVHVTLGQLTRTTFQVGYLLTVADETRATAVTVHGAVDTGGRGRRLPSWLAELVDPSR